jgi:hypothetical protein
VGSATATPLGLRTCRYGSPSGWIPLVGIRVRPSLSGGQLAEFDLLNRN